MELLQRLPLPRRLSSRVWLVTLPSALVSFERRQKVPKLPIGNGRYLGIPLIAGGAALAIWAWRRPGTSIAAKGPLARLGRRPATAGGIMVLSGVSLLLRSAVLAVYSIALVYAAGSDLVTIDDPRVDSFLGRRES